LYRAASRPGKPLESSAPAATMSWYINAAMVRLRVAEP
jgi:hypothetical protein